MKMNRMTMALQAFIVVGILGIILVIGYSKKDKEYLTYSREVRRACEKYVADKKIDLKFNEATIIFMKDLLDENYISEIKDKYCIYSVTYSKGFIFSKYKGNKDCSVIIENETEEDNTTIEENNTEE